MILYQTLENKLKSEGQPVGSYTSGRIDVIEELMQHAQERTDGLTFGQAFEIVRHGKRGMRLPQWAPDVVIRVQEPDEHSKMTAPYLYVESRHGRVPWKETNIELFSTDWCVVS